MSSPQLQLALGATLTPEVLIGMREWINTAERQELSDAQRVDVLAELEKLKSACCAAQAHVSVDFDSSQRQQQRDLGMAPEQIGRGVADQIALARHESPRKGAQLVRLANHLVAELPNTLEALERGDTNEWRATLIHRTTEVLDPEAQHIVDDTLAPQLPLLGDHDTRRTARAIALAIDPQAETKWAQKAKNDRHVTLRDAPDCMAFLTAYLPATDGAVAYNTLRRDAEAAKTAGDSRGLGQLMSDLLVERLTGRDPVKGHPVDINLIMSDQALLGGEPAPATLTGYGPLPAEYVRQFLASTEGEVWLRRLYTSPDGASLVAMDSTRRSFGGNLRTFIQVRDHNCRTPYCGAPIRNTDHAVPHAAGGSTSAANGQGLCQHCNLAKETPGWRTDVVTERPTAPHHTVVTTPTGHTYHSSAPPPRGLRQASHPPLPAGPPDMPPPAHAHQPAA